MAFTVMRTMFLIITRVKILSKCNSVLRGISNCKIYWILLSYLEGSLFLLAVIDSLTYYVSLPKTKQIETSPQIKRKARSKTAK